MPGDLATRSLVPREKYEAIAEVDEGFTLDAETGISQPWLGVRVRYRATGTGGHFKTFLLTIDGDKVPTRAQLQEACEAHAAI